MLPQKLEERRAWLRRGFASAVRYAIQNEAHLFLQVGDLFDSPEPRNAERQFVAEALADLRAAGVPCIGISGNHDTPRTRGASMPPTAQGTYARLGGLRLLGEWVSGGRGDGETGGARHPGDQGGEEPVIVRAESAGAPIPPSPRLPVYPSILSKHSPIDTEVLDVDGVSVTVGGVAPNPALPAGADPLEGVEWGPGTDLSVLLVHGSLQGHVYPGAPEPIIRRETVERLGVDCLLAGHVHKFAAFQWGRTSVIVPGATERMTFGEIDSRVGFVYLELEPGRTPTIHHIPVEAQPRRQLAIASSELDDEDPAATVMSHLEAVCGPETMVRLSLEGPITRQRYHGLRLRETAEYGAARCFFLDLETTGLYVEENLPRGAARGGRLSPKEELIRYGEEAREIAESDSERALVDEAMAAILGEYE